MVTFNNPLPSKIIFGKTRGAILALLYGRPDESFYLRQVVRASGCGLGPVQRELKLLTEAGIIRRTPSGRQVYFQANSESPVFPELKNLITKTVGVGDALRRALAPMKPLIQVAFFLARQPAEKREQAVTSTSSSSARYPFLMWY